MTESAEQHLVVRRVFRNGRRQYDPSSKARLVAECLLPDVSISRVALDNGVNANLLRKWLKEAKGAGPEGGLCPPAFIPVVMEECRLSTEKAAARGENCLAGTERTGPFSTPVQVIASLPSGVKQSWSLVTGQFLFGVKLGPVQFTPPNTVCPPFA